MASASTTQVLAATRQWLKPVIYILIRCGVTWRDFSELARTTFVEVATKQFGRMVAIRADQIISVPIADAVSRPKSVDPDGEIVESARSLGISFGDGR